MTMVKIEEVLDHVEEQVGSREGLNVRLIFALNRFMGVKHGADMYRPKVDDLRRVGAWFDKSLDDPFVAEFARWLLLLADRDIDTRDICR